MGKQAIAKKRPGTVATPLRNGRALVRVVLDGSWPCLTARGFVAGLSAAEREQLRGGGDALRRARKAVLVLPLALQNRPAGFTAQVVLGPVSAQQEAEWVGRLAGRLKIPCGCLVIGEIDELFRDPAQEPREILVAHVAVPPGEYLVEVFALLPGPEAWDLFSSGEGYRFASPGGGRGEPIGTYFRRTRPGVPFPDWLRQHLCEEPDDDPGHVPEWEHARYESPRDYLGHVIRLSPSGETGGDGSRQRGPWLQFKRRKPALCPLGIPLDSASKVC